MIKFNEILQRDQVIFISLLGGRPNLRTGYLARACGVDWPPPSPIPWSIRGLEPAYTRKVGACAGSGTSESFTVFLFNVEINLMNIQPNETTSQPQLNLFAGIDVGAEELVLVLRKNGKPSNPQTFANTSAGHASLIKKLCKLSGIIICMEATAKNHLHTLSATQETPNAVLRDARLAITQLEKRIQRLTTDVLLLIREHPELTRILQLLTSIKGISETSAIALMGELLLLPPDLSHREWVKFAGLDPKAFDSGKSVHKKTRLSKAGNRHIRSALYMPALSAKQHDPRVKAYFQHLVDNDKKPLQAVCAVMRKLLHAIHGMLKHDKPFDNTRFYAIPESTR